MAHMSPVVYQYTLYGSRPYENSPGYHTCSHRPWYKWWTSPHYRTIRRLSRADRMLVETDEPGLDEVTASPNSDTSPSSSSSSSASPPHAGPPANGRNEAPSRTSATPGSVIGEIQPLYNGGAVNSNGSDITASYRHHTAETPPTAPPRRVRIANSPAHILNMSAESGIDSAMTCTPNRSRLRSVDNDDGHNNNDDADADDDYDVGPAALAAPAGDIASGGDSDSGTGIGLLDVNLPPVPPARRGSAHRSSIASVEFHSAASSLTDDYSASVATASQKSLYFSISSDKDVELIVWQPEGDARN